MSAKFEIGETVISSEPDTVGVFDILERGYVRAGWFVDDFEPADFYDLTTGETVDFTGWVYRLDSISWAREPYLRRIIDPDQTEKDTERELETV